jgi:hypothetical protein
MRQKGNGHYLQEGYLRSTKCPFEIIIAPKKERKKERKIR